MNSTLLIRQATDAEINILLKIWIDKVLYLKNKNIIMWNTDQFSLPNLKRKYIDPVFYAAFLKDEIIGGFILIENDLWFWPEKVNDKAFYLHKLVVKNGHGGKGYSHEILEWIKDYGKKMSKDFIMLDFNESRNYLKELYLSHGFIPVEKAISPSGYHLVKAECILY